MCLCLCVGLCVVCVSFRGVVSFKGCVSFKGVRVRVVSFKGVGVVSFKLAGVSVSVGSGVFIADIVVSVADVGAVAGVGGSVWYGCGE